MTRQEKIIKNVKAIKKYSTLKPKLAIILGSGLDAFANSMREDKVTIPYMVLPHFGRASLAGHASRLHLGHLDQTPLAIMCGRLHYYEGYTIEEVTIPIATLIKIGVEKVIITNAAGGINQSFTPGDLMLINDHINMMGTNPLIGNKTEPIFPDMTCAYDRELRQIARNKAKEAGIDLQEGIYLALSGPTYETPAEVRMLRTLGADAVGMSTVPEAIVANHAGIKVLGISCITNLAAGISGEKLSHQEVKETGDRIKDKFITLLKAIIPALA